VKRDDTSAGRRCSPYNALLGASLLFTWGIALGPFCSWHLALGLALGSPTLRGCSSSRLASASTLHPQGGPFPAHSDFFGGTSCGMSIALGAMMVACA
jgi:hypothetical protein